MEEFEIALGADAAVKLEYKPVRKFQQTLECCQNREYITTIKL